MKCQYVLKLGSEDLFRGGSGGRSPSGSRDKSEGRGVGSFKTYFFKIALGFFVVLCLSSCFAPINVGYDFDKETNFDNLKIMKTRDGIFGSLGSPSFELDNKWFYTKLVLQRRPFSRQKVIECKSFVVFFDLSDSSKVEKSEVIQCLKYAPAVPTNKA